MIRLPLFIDRMSYVLIGQRIFLCKEGDMTFRDDPEDLNGQDISNHTLFNDGSLIRLNSNDVIFTRELAPIHENVSDVIVITSNLPSVIGGVQVTVTHNIPGQRFFLSRGFFDKFEDSLPMLLAAKLMFEGQDWKAFGLLALDI